jgi:hypothetical protein
MVIVGIIVVCIQKKTDQRIKTLIEKQDKTTKDDQG